MRVNQVNVQLTHVHGVLPDAVTKAVLTVSAGLPRSGPFGGLGKVQRGHGVLGGSPPGPHRKLGVAVLG